MGRVLTLQHRTHVVVGAGRVPPLRGTATSAMARNTTSANVKDVIVGGVLPISLCGWKVEVLTLCEDVLVWVSG